MDLQTTIGQEDELKRLTRDRELPIAALTEVAYAHRALSGDADSAWAVQRWNAALRQTEEMLYDLTELEEVLPDTRPGLFCLVLKNG